MCTNQPRWHPLWVGLAGLCVKAQSYSACQPPRHLKGLAQLVHAIPMSVRNSELLLPPVMFSKIIMSKLVVSRVELMVLPSLLCKSPNVNIQTMITVAYSMIRSQPSRHNV